MALRNRIGSNRSINHKNGPVTDRLKYTIYKRYLKQQEREQQQFICNLCSEEHPVTALILKGSDGRLKFLAPLYLSAQESEQRKLMGSGAFVDVDGQLPVSPPVFFFHFDLQEDYTSHPPQSSGSTRPFSCSSYSGNKHFSESRIRNKRSKLLDTSNSDWLQNCFLPGSPSQATLAISEVSDGDNISAAKPLKRNSRKKNKKKGKRYKKASRRKDHTEQKVICGRGFDLTGFETPLYPDPLCSAEHISENGSSESAVSSGLTMQMSRESDSEENSKVFGTPKQYASYGEKRPGPAVGSEQYSSEFSSRCRSTLVENSPHQSYLSETAQNLGKLSCSTDRDSTSANFNKRSNSSDSSDYFSGQDSFTVLDSCKESWNYDHSDGSCISDNIGNIKSSVQGNNKFISTGSEILNGLSTTDGLSKCAKPNSGDKSFENGSCNNNKNKTKNNLGIVTVTERAQILNETCGVNSSKACVLGKSKRHGKKRRGCLNNSQQFGSASTHSGTGKDISHSVWQRVQKKDIEERVPSSSNSTPCSPQLDSCQKTARTGRKNTPLVSRAREISKSGRCPSVDNATANNDALRLPSDCADSDELHCNLTIDSAPEKSKRNPPCSVTKQKIDYISRKPSQNGKFNVTLTKFCTPLNGLDVLSSKDHNKGSCPDLKSSPTSDTQKSSFLVNKFDHCQSLSGVGEKVFPRRTESVENLHSSVTDGLTHNAEHLSKSLSSVSLGSPEQKPLDVVHTNGGNSVLTEDSHCTYHHMSCNDFVGNMKAGTEGLLMEHNKRDHHSGSTMQKWIPVRKQDSHMFNTNDANNFSSCPDELVLDTIDSVNIDMDTQDSNLFSILSTTDSEIICSTCIPSNEDVLTTKSVECSLSEEIEKNNRLSSFEFNSVQGSKNQDILKMETDLVRIIDAANDAYKLQIASEQISLLTGSLLAPFERVLSCSSPVIGQMQKISSCKFCFKDKLVGNSVCHHQIPDVSLEDFWQWYEKRGSYGLEVKVDHHCGKLPSYDRSKFRAYFVPYLSAVQLFGHPKGSVCSMRNKSNDKDSTAYGVEYISNLSSELQNLPIFSTHREAIVAHPDCSLSAAKGDNCIHSVDHTCSDAELLFEYFESAPPQQRQPLFEKIKELVRGNMIANCQMYGDPSMLASLHLKEIHPSSWFSVAWYPIYRIPDGTFRASFLTYHSLGNLIYRSAELNSFEAVHIVCPAVGLQSYNAKGECWFQQNSSTSEAVKKKEMLSSPPDILKERLRTLEETASVMARASVHKGNIISVNRQPDYEFFLSRRW